MSTTRNVATTPRQRWSRQLHGRLALPDDDDWDELRAVWNGSVDRHPAMIALCGDAHDVGVAIAHARSEGLDVAVRSGGHSFPGLSVADDALVVDLSSMKQVVADPDGRTVCVGGGVLLGEMDTATQAVGMAVPTGAVSHTGVAGLTLGGGIGWLMRRHGLAIDQLVAAEVVTADGRTVTASADEHPDLFWGLRGGGGNFGVVTEFTFRLHEVGPRVLSCFTMWHLADAPEVARHYRDWSRNLPDDVTTALVFRRAPDSELVPPSLHGAPVVAVLGCWSGDLAAGARTWQSMAAHGTPVLDLTAPRLLVQHQSMLDASFPHGRWAYLKAGDVARLDDDVIHVAIEHANGITSPHSSVIAWQLGGAVARVSGGDTAFGGRDAGFTFNITGVSQGPEEFDRERRWVRDFWQALAPHAGGVYVNFLMDEGPERVAEAYGQERLARLRQVKTTWDPDNVFHHNQNIEPL